MTEPLPSPPPRIGGLEIGERLRSSGVLAVHAGTDSLGLEVHVHLVPRDALSGDFTVKRFLGRLRRAAEVRHETVLPYTTGGQTEADERHPAFVYAVARHTDAPGVDEMLGRGGALDERRALSIAAAVASALGALAHAKLRHGGLTPRRILLPGRGQVQLGPPRLLPPALEPRRNRYQAPEDARGERGDARSDLYVLGLILVEMLTGNHPVAGSGAAVRRAIAAGPQVDCTRLLSACGPRTQAVAARLLAPKSQDRYQNAAQAENALRQAADGGPGPAEAIQVIPAVQVPAAAPLPAPVPAEPVAAEAIPVAALPAAPLDPDRPETAPIDLRREPAAPAPPPAAAAEAGPAATRNPGRLYLEARLGESMLELDQDTWVGKPAGALDLHARAEPFDEAVFRVEPTVAGDVLHAIAAGVCVNGSVIEQHTLGHGDTIEAPEIRARYERQARKALRATGGVAVAEAKAARTRATLVMAIGGIATVAVVVWGLLAAAEAGRGGSDAFDARDAATLELAEARDASRPDAGSGVPAGTPGTGPASPEERDARSRLDEARAWIRAHADDPAGGRQRLLAVAELYPKTAFGALARAEADELARRARTAESDALDRLVEQAADDAMVGMLDEAVLRLRNYAEERPGTLAAERARQAMTQIEGEVRARFDNDMARVDAALTKRNWKVASDVLDRVMEYVPTSLRDTALARSQRLKNAMEELFRGGESAGGGSGGGSKPPAGGESGGGSGGGTEPEPTGPAAGAARDAQAQTLFKQARRSMSSNDDVEALRAFIDFLKEYKDTPTGQKYELEVRERIRSLAAGDAGIVMLFNGVVEKRKKGRWRFSYDFEDDDQLADFRDVNAFEAPPRANWTIVSGAARAKGSGALVLDAKFKTEFVSVAVTVNPERAHDLGVALLETGDPQRQYLYTLQNSFFTLGLGDEKQVFRENAIVLFGRDMWRDTPPGELGFVRKAGSDAPEVPVGQNLKIKAGKSEGEVWFRFPGGRTIRGSAYGDLKYEFVGLEPGVFVLNSSGYFDDLVIEGVLDTDWVHARWEQRLSDL